MIAVKIYTGEVRGKLDGNSNQFTTDNSKAVPPGRGLHCGGYLALSPENLSRDLFTEQ